jgi:hypothetical protein
MPRTKERARKATLSAALIKAATQHPNKGTVDCDLWAAIHRAAADVVEEMYWVTQSKGAKGLAPSADETIAIQRAREADERI